MSVNISEVDPANPDYNSVKVQGVPLPTTQDVLNVISTQTMPLLAGQTPDNLVKATAPGLVVDAGVAPSNVLDPTSHAKLPTGKAVSDYITSIQNTFKYVKEWHVSPTLGSNSNVGSEDAPFQTISHALTKIDGSGHALFLHTGTYAENITLNLQHNFDVVGAAGKSSLVNLTGLWTFAGSLSAASVRATKVNFAGGIALSGVTGLYLLDAQHGTLNKTGGGYFEAVDTDGNGVVTLTGAGMALYVSSTVVGMVINNAGAVGVTRDCKTVGPVVVTAGIYQDDNSTNYAVSSTGYAVSSTVNGAVYMQRGACLTPTSTVARVQLLGPWSISNMAFDEANSVLSGTQISTFSYFDSIKTLGSDGLVAANTARTKTARVSYFGLDLPQYTATEIAALAGMPNGRTLWNSTDAKPQYWSGTAWVQLGATAQAGVIPQHTLATRPTVVDSIGENTTLNVIEVLMASGWKPVTALPVAGLITSTTSVFIAGLYINNSGASIGTLNVGAAGYYDGTGWTDNVYLSLNLPVVVTVAGVTYQKSGTLYVVPTAVARAPTVTVLRSGSGTYTAPAGVAYLRVRAIAGGGGGSGGGAQSGYDPTTGNGTEGGDTTFGNLTLKGGSKNYSPVTTSVTLPAGFVGFGIPGAGGPFGGRASATNPASGGNGASTPLGSGGGCGTSDYGAQSPQATTGAGGGGGGTFANGGANGGTGGGSGDYAEFIISAPAATYSYAVGAGGAGGGPLGAGNPGANGADGVIIIEEFY